jgi:hypothetical protein
VAQHGNSAVGVHSIDERSIAAVSMLPGQNLFRFYVINAKSVCQRKASITLGG